MLRNTFFALATLLAVASSSQAAILIQVSPAVDIGQGLSQYTLTAVSDSGQTINTFAQPNATASGGGAGLHQVWAPFSATGTPTEGDQTPPLWNDAWKPFDSFFFFTAANSLAVGGAYSETNNGAGGAAGLPNGVAGPPTTGFGTLSAGGSRLFTAASNIPDSSVPFAQFVMKSAEQVLLDIGILDTQGNRQDFTDFLVGGGAPPNTPPSVDEEVDQFNVTAGDVVTTTFTGTDAQDAPGALVFSNAVLSSFTPLFPGAVNPAFNGTVLGNGNFSWDTTGFARGVYDIDVTVSDTGGLSASGGNFGVTISVVPEPSTLALLGLAFVGSLGMIRRRNG